MMHTATLRITCISTCKPWRHIVRTYDVLTGDILGLPYLDQFVIWFSHLPDSVDDFFKMTKKPNIYSGGMSSFVTTTKWVPTGIQDSTYISTLWGRSDILTDPRSSWISKETIVSSSFGGHISKPELKLCFDARCLRWYWIMYNFV